MSIVITHAPVSLDAANSTALTQVGQKLKLDESVLEVNMDIDDLKTLSGVAGGSTNLGTFSGSTISDNVAIKAALQELETAVEGISVTVDLAYTASPTNGVVTNTAGDNATLTLGTTVNAGLLAPAQFDKLTFISVTGAIDLDSIPDGNIASAATWNAKQDALTFGIADGNAVDIDAGASIVANDYAKFSATGLIGQTYAEVKTDLSLNLVENTALSTWAGTTNITTLGTIATGTWEGTTIAVDQGGSGQTSYTDGQLLIGNTTGNTLAKATLSGGTNLSVVNGSGTITLNVDDAFLLNTGDVGTGVYDFGGADSFEIPNSATPTVNADGEIALDTTVTDFSHGIIKFYGGEEQGIVSMPIAEFTSPTDGDTLSYNATNDEFEMVQPSGGDYIKISQSTASASATISFTGLTNTYRGYKVIITEMRPATDATILRLRTSTNGGSSYDTSGYQHVSAFFRNPSTHYTGGTGYIGMGSIGNGATEFFSAEFLIYWPAGTQHTMVSAVGGGHHDTYGYGPYITGGARESAADVDAIEFSMSSGNITEGVFTLYGIKD